VKTVTLKSVLEQAADFAGISYENQLSPEQRKALIRIANFKLRTLWESFPWPPLTVLEQRQYRPSWSIISVYAAGDEIYDPTLDAYYESVQSGNNDHARTDTAWWTPATDLDRYLEIAASGKTVIGQLFAVTDLDPRLSSVPTMQPFELRGDRVQFDSDAPNTPWLEFQLMPSPLSPKVWASAENVTTGEVRYYESGIYGDCYIALANNTATTPPSDAAKWALCSVPDFLAEALAWLISADQLRADGQDEKAMQRESMANTANERAMQRFNTFQHQAARWAVAA
jgi:hypothetical protein